MDDIVTQIENDILKYLNGDENHHKNSEGHQDITHGQDEAGFGIKSLIDGPGYIYYAEDDYQNH